MRLTRVFVAANDDYSMMDREELLLKALHHESTARCVTAERLVLKHLGGGCQMALGALATESDGEIFLRAVFIPDSEGTVFTAEASATTAEDVARRVADQLLS